MSAIIRVTPEEIREAVRIFDLLDSEDVSAVTKAMSEATEAGARTVAAIQEAAKQNQGAQSILASVVVTNFLVGYLAGLTRAEEPYCTFVDTGERRFPKSGEWYYCVKFPMSGPRYYAIEIALGYEIGDYGILRMVPGAR